MRETLTMLRCIALAAVAAALTSPALAARGQVEIQVVEKQMDAAKPIAVRMHLKNERNQPRKVPGVPYWKDHFVFDGKITLKLPPGTYTFELERGPEYRLRTGHFTIARDSDDTKQIEMVRFVDMKQEGWWSGELHVHRPVKDIELLMRAEDLHVAPVITWWNDRNQWAGKQPPEEPLKQFDGDRYYHIMAGEDEREGGALMYFNLPEPLAITGAGREFPSPMTFLREARSHEGVHVDIEKPFWWDVPVWIAGGMVDSIGLANNHMHRDGVLATEAWGKPRDKTLYPDAHGNGRWSQDIYYHLLNCGLRIPPSAGSASGVLPNPVGYNRVYVHCGYELTYKAWWEGLRAGRVVVTNGPLLRARVDGQLPGHVFQADRGRPLQLKIDLKLSTREPVEYLEVVKNGRVAQSVRLDKWAEAGGRLPPLSFDESGWFLIRVVTENPKTYRFASTGPYYVEVDGRPRISKASAQFFLDWVYERARRVKLDDKEQRRQVLQYHRAARDYWQKLVDSANAD